MPLLVLEDLRKPASFVADLFHALYESLEAFVESAEPAAVAQQPL